MSATVTERPVSEYETWLLEQSWAAPYPPSGITFTDFFCGFGGSSIGLTEAGMQLVWAANHWKLAIENHAANFRHADHFQGDISGYDMRRVPKADVAWISPECTWHSPAGGRKRIRAELDALFPDEHVASEAGERSRATMWDVVRAAEAKAFKIVIVENVVEVTAWPLFEAWLHAMDTLGYNHQIVCVTAAHIGDDRNPYAPQWRDRIYFVFYKKSIPFPVIEPRPLAWCEQCGKVVESRQKWKKPDGLLIGKYGPQYYYVCSTGNHASTRVEPYVLPAASAIDWSDLGTRIGDRPLKEFWADKKKTQSLGFHHLAPATGRRVAEGIRMFARPIVAAAAGQTYDAASAGHPRKFYRVAPADSAPLDPRMTTGCDGVAVPPFMTSVNHGADAEGRHYLPGEQPLPTRSTKIGDGMVVPPFISQHYGAKDGDERRNFPADSAPLGTVVASGAHHSLVTPPFIAELRGTSTARAVENDALGAITAGGNHHGLTIPDGAFIQKHHDGLDYPGVSHMVKDVFEPLPSIVARANTSLVIPYRRGSRAYPAGARPLHTVSTVESGGLVTPTFSDAELEDIVLNSMFRMLGPREHGRAQRFPDAYAVKGTKGNQTKGFGNAVASNVAHWLGRFCVIALSGQVSRSERAA